MELQNKITIKKSISKHPITASQLKKDGEAYETSLAEFSELTGLSIAFLKMNINQIRNWID